MTSLLFNITLAIDGIIVVVAILVVVSDGVDLFWWWGERTGSGINRNDLFLNIRGIVIAFVSIDKIAVVFAGRVWGDSESVLGGVGR